MIKADKYLQETVREILLEGYTDQNPRPKWADGTPAHAKYVTQKVFKYDILKDEFPITTLRNTALKGAFHDIESIYIKQTNIIEEMHPSIHSWWTDFVVGTTIGGRRSIGQTYGDTVKRYGLVDKLLEGMVNSPFSRRHMINLWQERQMIADPKALVPCAYMTNYNIKESAGMRFIDMTLHQRSQDFCMTASINPAQYVMFGMMIAGHLTFITGIEHYIANFMHIVENCHIYDRHLDAANEILDRKPILEQPIIRLKEAKSFYDYTWEDFKITLPEGIKPLSTKLELAI